MLSGKWQQFCLGLKVLTYNFLDNGDNPVGTRHNNNVFTTSTWRRWRSVDVVKTLSLRHYYVMCPLEMLILWHSHESNITKDAQVSYPWYEFKSC